jgi:4-hydroxybenzoate polyprenyltransferase
MSRVSPYLQLLRVPATPTAASNILMGYLVANESWSPVAPLVALLASSLCIYSAGMVLNDVADIEEDRRLRPYRPLPSGRIPVRTARNLGWTLLAIGVAAGFVAGWLSGSGQSNLISWRGGIVATVLAIAVVAYDHWLKQTLLGPLALGGCRLLNVLLGMSTATISSQQVGFASFSLAQWSIAAGVGVYIVGVSWLARREVESMRRSSLIGASLVMASGLIWLLSLPWWGGDPEATTALKMRSSLLYAFIAIPLSLRLARALHRPTPVNVQRAVTTSLFSLILIDAILCFVASGGQATFALVVAGLIVPSLVLARWARAT